MAVRLARRSVPLLVMLLQAGALLAAVPPSCSDAPAPTCYHGNELAYITAVTAYGACCAACGNKTGCVTYSYTAQKQLCKLYDDTARAHTADPPCQSGSSTNGPPAQPALAPNTYGPYCDAKDDQLATEYPFISGFTSPHCSWGSVEPRNGVFNWTQCRGDMEYALQQGKYLLLSPQTGNYAPVDWLPSAGVPAVAVCSHNWKKDPSKCPQDMLDTFPYYMAPAYHGLWRRYHQQLHDMIKSLPAPLAARVRTVQVMQGATGDLTPWHGTPVDAKYAIDDDAWKELWVNGTATMIDVWSDLLPTTKLLFNAVPPLNATEDMKPWPEYRHLIMDVLQPPNFACKYGMESHQYFINYELDDYAVAALTRTPHVSKYTGEVDFVRSRGEMSDGSDTESPGIYFWNYPSWNLFATATWSLTFGLDVLDPNPQIWSREQGKCKANWTEAVWPSLQHLHVYAGRKVPAESPGAWIQLRDALDATDLARFPEAQFGDASPCLHGGNSSREREGERTGERKGELEEGPLAPTCADRVQKIVAAFASRGAVVQDMAAATGGRNRSRKRLGLNSAGLRIWPTNYAQYMAQADPVGTSVGRWRVGSDKGVFGNYARSTDSRSGRTNMTFALERGVFNSTHALKAWNCTALHLRVGYFDEGRGSWELEVGYSKHTGLPPAYSTVGRVTKGDSGEWAEARAVLDAPPSGFSLQDLSHLRLMDDDAGKDKASADDDTFAWLEVSKIPFAFNFTASVVNFAG